MRLRRCLGQIDYGIGEASKPAGDIAVLGMGNIDDRGRIVGEPGGYVESVDSRLLLHPGDLLFNRTNSLAKVGKVGLVRELAGPTTFASYLVRFRSSSVADTAYLNYALNTEDVLGLARSTALPSIGQANLNPSRYSELYVSLPSMDEQHRIVHDLDAERRHTEVLGSRLTRQIGLLQERRQALITAAVTGELDIPGVAA
jgi:type I restriction enzyme S subunit